MHSTSRRIAIPLALSLISGACNSGGGDDTAASETDATTTATTATTTTAATETTTDSPTTTPTTTEAEPTTTEDEPTTGDAPPIEPPGEALMSDKQRNESPNPSADDLAAMASDELAFALELFGAAAGDGNQAISPTSLRIAFAQVYEGARTDTETQIQQVLHFSLAKPALHNAFNALDLALEARDLPPSGEVEGDDSVTVDLYNQLFGRADITWKPAFLDVLAEHYGSNLHVLDFAGDPDGARVQINDWVLAVTRDKIVDLLPPGSIDAMVTGVLVNALYLKAPWAAPFDYVEESGSFTLADATTIAAPMMHGAFDTTRHYQAPGVQAAELALRGGQLKLVVILPDAGTFDAFTTDLTPAALDTIFAGLTSLPLNVDLPRFKFSSTFALAAPLKALGMVQPFAMGQADFSGLADGQMNIRDVFHQVFVAVDEKGVEAAAASAIVLEDSGGGIFPEDTFTADRPFYFAIRDLETDSTLFFGRVLDPTK